MASPGDMIRTAGWVAGLWTLQLVSITPALRGQASSELWFDLEPGPYPVGFAAWYEFDESRSFFELDGADDPGRPVRVFLWYPADSETTDPAPMTWGQYLQPDMPDESDRFLETYQAFLYQRELDTSRRQFSPLNAELHRRLLETRVAATEGAPPSPDRHPVILHSLGLGDFQQESTVLWEYLASHGYVIAVVPQVGPSASDSGLDFELSDLRVQVEDLAFAMSVLERVGLIEPTDEVGLIGHSAGGMAGLMLARSEPRLRAIAGFDASFSTGDGATLFRQMDFPFSEITASVMDARVALKGSLDPTALESMTSADRYEIKIGGDAPPAIATHFDFQNWPLYGALMGVEDDRGAGARSLEAGKAFYLAAVRYARLFFDHALRGSEQAEALLVGARPLPGVNNDWIAIRYLESRQNP